MKPKTPKQPKQSNAAFKSPEIQHIAQLLEFMSEHNLEEFEYSRGDLRIRLKKPGVVVAGPRMVSAPEIIVSGSPEVAAASATASGAAPAVPEARPTEDLHLVKSPIVGTYYGSPNPGSEPFAKVGAYVEVGQTLCIVEAMKLMNEIESDETGEVVKAFVENGQPVEYGQPLFAIRPSRKK